MQTKNTIAIAAILAIALFLGTLPSMGHHDNRVDERIVQPYGVQVLFHIPILAGYEPVPTPQNCLPGHAPANVIYHEDFAGAHGWSFIQTPLATPGPGDPATTNLWHVTSWPGPGGDTGHSSADRLYFGLPPGSSDGIGGTYRMSNENLRHVAGTAQSPPIDLPDETGLVLAYNTKWAVEWLKGYDHMWVELLDEAGKTHLLCTNNAFDRGDGTSSGDFHRIGSCSPILFGPCPTGTFFSPPNSYPANLLPLWETRMIEIPDELAGQSVQVRLTYDTADGVANEFLGWMVDDVQIGHA